VPRIDLDLSIDIERTPRVAQVEGIFDVPEAKRRTASFHFDAPIEDRDWQIGLIKGPSGAGKTSIARHLFGDCIVDGYEWGSGAVVDAFPQSMGIRDVTAALSSVGFSSPPSWTKPFHVLSNGEKFRANLARALVDVRPTIAIDEFTSVVDRTVGKIGSHAVSKAIRRQPGRRLIAITCHDDVTEWLQPDWIIEPHVGGFHWRSVQQRPSIELEIVRCDYSAWKWFAPHHYLDANLAKGARCFAGLIDGQPAGFAALRNFPHPSLKRTQAVSRVVALPDFQGFGLVAHHMMPLIGSVAATNGWRMLTRPAHPALIKTWARSPLWEMVSPPSRAAREGRRAKLRILSRERRVASFRYVGPAHEDRAMARKLWGKT